MKNLLLFILALFASGFLHAQILVTPAQVTAINTAQSAASGDIYKDTENNVFYIGTSSGLLKIIGDFSKVDGSLTGDGSVANPLRISSMGASSGQVLSWNGTSWAPVNASASINNVSNTINAGQLTTTVNGVTSNPVTLPAALPTYFQNGATTTVSGNGSVWNPYWIEANIATTTDRGVLILTGDFAGNGWWPVIANGAVVNSRIGANAVTTDKIQNGTIKTEDLEWGLITNDKLAVNSVTYDKIQQMPGQTLLGNPYSGSASPLAITLGTGLSFNGTVLNASGASWNLLGNTGTNPTNNFLGTTDYQRLVFRTNNIERATFLPTGFFGLGLTDPGATFHNNGSTIFTVRTIPNKATGGDIETATNSVNIGTVFAVNQTTAAQTLTLPWPFPATAGRVVKVSNSGSASFTMYSIVIHPAKFAEFLWTGSAWIPTVGTNSVLNKKMVLSAEYAGAVITPGSGSNHNGDLYGDNTGAVFPNYYMNYYEWMGGSSSGAQTYQVIVRVTLPNDFTEWQTTAFQYVNMAQNGCSVDLDIYNVSTGTIIYSGSPITNTSWTTTNLANTSLTNWITPGQTVAVVITFSATNNSFSRIGDIVLNYK